MVSIRARWKIADEKTETTSDVAVTIEGTVKSVVDMVYDNLIKALGEPERRKRL